MSDTLFSVAGQVVLVSGASRGIGRAIARGFAEGGANVIITGRDKTTLQQTSAELTSDKITVRPIVCDVAKSGDIKSLVKTIIDDYDHIDTLINVAGINIRKPAEDFTEADYDTVLDINSKGAFLLSQLVGIEMIRTGKGSQINITSLNNDRPLKHCLPYAMSKAGLGQMTKILALEWGPHGIRVNAIAPGFILTDLNRDLWADENLQAWGQMNIPQRRLGTPDDMIGAAIFLASSASAYLTGQILYVDGGFTAGWAWPISSN